MRKTKAADPSPNDEDCRIAKALSVLPLCNVALSEDDDGDSPAAALLNCPVVVDHDVAEVTNVSYGWTTIQRDKTLLFVEAAYKNNPDALKLAAVLAALEPHRESGSPSVKKLLADVDTALL